MGSGHYPMAPFPPSTLHLRLSAMSAAMFMAPGLALGFLPVWLGARGLDASQIGIVLAIMPAARVVASPFVTALADRRFLPADMLVAMHLLVAAVWGVMSFQTGFWPIAIVMVIAATSQAGIMPVCDLMTMRETMRHRGLRYGPIRAWGSVAFLISSLIGGWVVANWSPHAVMPMMAAYSLLGAGVALLQPRTPEVPEPRAGDGGAGGGSSTAVMVLVVAGLACAHSSHMALYGFGTLLWSDRGLSAEVIGVLWALCVLSETLLFYFGAPLSSRLSGVLALMAAGQTIAAIRWLMMIPDTGLGGAAILQMTHAATFGITHLAGLVAITRLAPAGRRGRVQGIAVAFVAAACAASSMVSGILFRAYGPAMFLAMVPISVTAIVCFLAAARLARKDQPQSAGEGG